MGGRAPGSVGAAACGMVALSGSRVADLAGCSRVAGQTVHSTRVEARSGYSMGLLGLLGLQGHHPEGCSSSAPSHSTFLHGCSRAGMVAELEWGQTAAEKRNSAVRSECGSEQ